MSLEELRLDCAQKQKKGLHFILASVVIWIAVFFVHFSELPILTKNLFTFFCTAPLVPMAFLISKVIGVDFQNKENPLTDLGIIFSVNQILYLLIAMWIFPTLPEKMLMVIAIIFGAHLLPFGWLYKSRSYFVFSVIIAIGALIIGISFPSYILALIMIFTEIIFSFCLYLENRALEKYAKTA